MPIRYVRSAADVIPLGGGTGTRDACFCFTLFQNVPSAAGGGAGWGDK